LSASVNANETPMANTIKIGTTPIEEVALIPELLRFESEPWTLFYMAGEIIRELRKALECKQAGVPAPKNEIKEGRLKDDQLQRLSPAETSRRELNLSLNNVPL
jgi:hypothetical protein